MNEESKVSEATLDAEHSEAQQAHEADRVATADEEAAARRGKKALASEADAVAEHFEEMADLGAHVKGEGAIE